LGAAGTLRSVVPLDLAESCTPLVLLLPAGLPEAHWSLEVAVADATATGASHQPNPST
jgi:hypothetical protein